MERTIVLEGFGYRMVRVETLGATDRRTFVLEQEIEDAMGEPAHIPAISFFRDAAQDAETTWGHTDHGLGANLPPVLWWSILNRLDQLTPDQP